MARGDKINTDNEGFFYTRILDIMDLIFIIAGYGSFVV